MARRLLITGASGFIGSRLSRDLAGDFTVVGTCRGARPGLAAMELSDPDSVERAFRDAAPAAVVHTAAISAPDRCEDDPAYASRVNRDAVVQLAGLCRRAGVRFIHFSTDLVFDGEKGRYTEDDEAKPLSLYGRLKLEAERGLLEACPGAAVLRVSTVYGRALSGRPSMLDDMLAALSRGERFRGFTDQWKTSTPVSQLPGVVAALLRRDELSGVFHWASPDRVTRHEFARIACEVFGFDPGRVEPCSAAAVRFFRSPRPRDSSLVSDRLSGLLRIPLLPLREGLARERAACPA